MANIFAILTAIALAAGAFLAFKNKGAYEEAIQERQRAEGNLARSQKRFGEAVDDLKATTEERKETETATEAMKEDEAAQQTKNAGIESDIKTKRTTTERNAKEIEKLEATTAEIGPIEELAGKVKKLREDIVGLEDEKSMGGAMQANLVGEKTSTEQTIQGYNDESRKVNNKISYGGASITAIYPAWGFVTLSAGSTGGIVAGSKLDVVRGGETVAQLQVRSVESGRASADVIPDSVAEDEMLMIGDKVVPGK